MKFINKVINYLPDGLRWELMRQKIKLPTDFPPELQIRLALNTAELKAAYSILQQSYKEEGLTNTTNSGMRVLKQFAMPSTATIVILWKSEVIGTVSLIRDNPLGLPLEKIFDLTHLRNRNLHLAEVSSLAISNQFRSKHGKLLFPLFKSVFQFGKDVLHVDGLVIAVNPRWRDFYSGLYGFKTLDAKVVENYDFVNGAPAIGLVFEYQSAFQELRKTYKKATKENNIFSHLWETEYSCITLPQQEYFSTIIKHIDEENFRDFFLKDEQTFSQMNTLEQLMVKRSVIISKKGLLPELATISEITPRKNYRFDVNLTAQAKFKHIKVHDVSREGMRLDLSGFSESKLAVDLQVSKTKSSKIIVEPVWQSPKTGLWGTKIVSNDEVWNSFIDYQEQKFGINKSPSADKAKATG